MEYTAQLVIGIIISIILAWVIASLLLWWAKPEIYDDNGDGVNWWTTLWVTVVTVIILYIVLFILALLFNRGARSYYMGMGQQAQSVMAY